MFATNALSRPLRRLELATAGSVLPELKPRGPKLPTHVSLAGQPERLTGEQSHAAHSRWSPEAEGLSRVRRLSGLDCAVNHG